MDAKLFRLPTSPNYYKPIQSNTPVDVREVAKRQQIPAPDPRFPGWAGQMEDGRLVTNYDPHCASNIPAGRQFPTKEWMQKNAEDIIMVSRKRSAEITGAIFPFDESVVPPPAMKVKCKPSGCTRVATEAVGGIGMEREGADAPDLFGTYDPTGFLPAKAHPARTALTTRYEGGRNSLRGQFGPDKGSK